MAASGAGYFDYVKVVGSSREETIARVTLVATLLDSAFRIPGLRRRIGLDAVIGLAPGVGDLIAAALGSYIIWEASRLGLPRRKIARMIANLVFDTAIGAVPVAGDAFDIFFKANMRNLRIIHEHFGMRKRGPS
ncbi:DUF4112 domain-containing protein [Microvirga terricola]|uniref:DUF4112 domain-containing protein n=1 Tax=Microvirga terricola TaxID=2719797 RepID=A0ABX0V8S1_9HYPH|nr:DUF4112 domain-containing protein [Microvirga terricola]NIX76214.1 DUF4112 domain-containing protein [Microvirga terricola]